MDVLCAILVWTVGVSGISFLLLLLWTIYYECSKITIAPEFDHSLKLRIIHYGLLMAMTLGEILEQLGICGTYFIIRSLMSLRKPKIHPSLSVKDQVFDGVPVRIYQPKASFPNQRKGLVFLHGGGGVIGSISCYQDVCSKLAKDSDSVVVSVEYRLGPEHLYPTQQKDCYAATVYFIQNAKDYGVDPSQIIIGGDSAGGNFATVVAQELLGRPDLPKLRAQVLIYPAVQLMDFNLPSYQQNAACPLLYRRRVVWFLLHYLGKRVSLLEEVLQGSHVPDALRLKYGKWVSPDNIPEKFKRRGYKEVPLAPYKPEVYKEVSEFMEVIFSPLFAEDSVIRQLPETLIVSCEYDVIRDDSLLYKKRLEENGVKVSWFHAENGFHGVINFIDKDFLTFPAGIEILGHIAEFIKHL